MGDESRLYDGETGKVTNMCSTLRYSIVALLMIFVLPGASVAEEISYNYLHIDYSDMTSGISAADYQGTGFEATFSHSYRAPVFAYARYEQHDFDELFLIESVLDIGSGVVFDFTENASAYITIGYAGINWATIIGSIPNFGSTTSAGFRVHALEQLEFQVGVRYMDVARIESKTTYEVDGRLWLGESVAIGWTGQIDADGDFGWRIGGRVQW